MSKRKMLTILIEVAFREVHKATCAILTETQLLTFCRRLEMLGFACNFPGPFTDARVSKFLELSGEQRVQMLHFARVQRFEYFRKCSAISGEIFDSLTNKLSEDSRRKLQELFRDTWTIPMCPTVRWYANW